MSSARVNCRRPFSASRRAISIWIAKERRVFCFAVAILGHVARRESLYFSVRLSNHLTRDSLILDMSIAVGEAPPLLSELSRRHGDLAGADD